VLEAGGWPAGQFLVLDGELDMFGLFSNDGIRFVIGYAKIADDGTSFAYDENDLIYDSAGGGWTGVDESGDRAVNERIVDIMTGIWETVDPAMDLEVSGWNWATDWTVRQENAVKKDLSDVYPDAKSYTDRKAIGRDELSAILVDCAINHSETAVAALFSVYNPVTKESTQVTKAFPLASESNPGQMPKESFAALVQAVADIESLKAAGGRWITQNFDTKAALDAFAVPPSVNIGDWTDVLEDETHGGHHTRYAIVDSGGTKGFAYQYDVEGNFIGTAGTDTPGLLMGVADDPANAGKIFAETDGSMSVIGWDDLVSRVSNLESWKTTHDGDSARHVTDTERTAWNGKVSPEAGRGLSTNDFTDTYKNLLGFLSATRTVTSLANIDMTASQTVYASIGSNQSLSCSGTPPTGQFVHVFVRNTGATDLTIVIPTAGSYVSMCGASVTLPASGYVEFNIAYDTSQSKYKIVAVEAA
jgi:hypothetical protein